MIVGFRHKGLRAFFETGSAKGVRPEHLKRLRLILARLHALKGKLKGRYAVAVSGNWRVTFRFDGPDAMDVDYVDYH